MDPSWALTWPPHREEEAGRWAASKLADARVDHHLVAVLAQGLCRAAAGQQVHLTLATADTRVRLTARTDGPIPERTVRSWQERTRAHAHRHGADGPRELWAELDCPAAQPGAMQ
jgi:hypothetical protein